MSKWDVMLFVNGGLAIAAVVAVGWIATTYGDGVARQMPITWILLGIAFLLGGGATLGYYKGVWREITGGVGGPRFFFIWVLLFLAASAIVRGILGFFSR